MLNDFAFLSNCPFSIQDMFAGEHDAYTPIFVRIDPCPGT